MGNDSPVAGRVALFLGGRTVSLVTGPSVHFVGRVSCLSHIMDILAVF